MQVQTVECMKCGTIFGARVGWQPYDEGIAARMAARGHGRRVLLRTVTPNALTAPGAPSAMQMRVPLRVRQCRDHEGGTQGCDGVLERNDGAKGRRKDLGQLWDEHDVEQGEQRLIDELDLTPEDSI